jgi:glycosyltransferase involved in cell wall biosynthesis
MPQDVFVSILILTHNAPDLVRTTLESLRAKTSSVAYEVVVLDNASAPETVTLVEGYKASGVIDTLILSEENTLFAGGNNLAARAASDRATHYCLLNSDIELRRADWLSHLLMRHKRGITAFGMQRTPLRVDGYALLIDADLYQSHPLDESHQWWWSVTKMQAKILIEGHSGQGYFEHDDFLYHFGGGSGDAFKSAKGMNVTYEEVNGWFEGHRPVVLDPFPFQLKYRLARLRALPGRAVRKLVQKLT